MNCYNNLSVNSKRGILFRVIYINVLLILIVYGVIILSNFNHSWFLIPITVANFLSFFHSILHIWYIIHYNHVCNIDDGFLLILGDVIYNVIILSSNIGYAVYLSTQTSFIVYELVIFGLYSLIIVICVIIILLSIIACFCGCILSTVDVVNERNKVVVI